MSSSLEHAELSSPQDIGSSSSEHAESSAPQDIGSTSSEHAGSSASQDIGSSSSEHAESSAPQDIGSPSSSERAGSSSPKDSISSYSTENLNLPPLPPTAVADPRPPENWHDTICLICKKSISAVALTKPCNHIFDHNCLERWLWSVKGCQTNKCKQCHGVIKSFQHSFRGDSSDFVEQTVDPPFKPTRQGVRFEKELGAAIGIGKIRISISHGILQVINHSTVFRVMRDRDFDVDSFPARMRLEIAARIRSEIRRHQSLGQNRPAIDAPEWVRQRIVQHEVQRPRGFFRRVWDAIWRK